MFSNLHALSYASFSTIVNILLVEGEKGNSIKVHAHKHKRDIILSPINVNQHANYKRKWQSPSFHFLWGHFETERNALMEFDQLYDLFLYDFFSLLPLNRAMLASNTKFNNSFFKI